MEGVGSLLLNRGAVEQKLMVRIRCEDHRVGRHGSGCCGHCHTRGLVEEEGLEGAGLLLLLET